MVAGLDTTLTVSEFTLFMLGKKPDLQEQIYNELKQNFDANKISSINNCPLFRAFVHESMRNSNISAFGLPRYTTKNIKVKLDNNTEYNIPKNSIVFPNFLKIMDYFEYNRGKYESWVDPGSFNVNNFLDGNGKFKKTDSFPLFGTGKRDCLGRTLAYKL